MHSSSNVAPASRRLGRSKLASRPVNLHLSPDIMPTPPPNSRRSPQKAPHPVLRWFGHSTPHSPSMPSSPAPPSPDTMENLSDALTSPLPAPTLKQPPRAAVPANMPLSGSPFFLRGLSRVTLPTASLSNLAPAARPFDPPVDSRSPGAPIFLHPERSSLDALRSLHNRESGSSARPARKTSRTSSLSPRLFTTSATPSWWFQPDNKENVDRLLSEEDRAPTVEEEQSRIHKKCA